MSPRLSGATLAALVLCMGVGVARCSTSADGGGTLGQIAAFVEGHDGELYVVYGAGSGALIGRLATQ
jgi:hypothetical protein